MLLFKLIILKRSTLAMASYNLTKLKGDQANIATIKLRRETLVIVFLLPMFSLDCVIGIYIVSIFKAFILQYCKF